MTALFTIGYEGATVPDFIDTLVAAGVKQVLDIRELPQSRRPGFSKNILAAALEAAGVDYRHIKQLGDPKHGRDAARAGRYDEFRAIFAAHLDLPASAAALSTAAALIEEQPTVLLCYERDPKQCHRTLVADRLKGLKSIRVQHLGVRHGDRAAKGSTVAPAAADR